MADDSREGPFTREVLADDFRELGVRPGDALFIHSSFKSLGPVAGGAQTVVQALEDAVGPGGLILMPSFNLVKGDRTENWDHATTPSTVGWLTEYFRTMPGTIRSDHYSHSVAARGPEAEAFVAGHLGQEGLVSPWDREPWGRTYGAGCPMIKAYERPNSKLLMLGVDYHSSTYCHIVEVRFWTRLRESDPNAEYHWLDRDKLGAHWDTLGRVRRGCVGKSDCRLSGIRDYVDTLLALVEADPLEWSRWPKRQ